MSVMQDIREKGVIGASAAALEDVFTRVTAGISPGEFRKMLRGEPAGRPNPRLKPHSEAFLLHIKPTYYHESVTKWNHTFRLGLLSTYLFFLELITGLLLMIWYAPSPERAYVDMIRLLSNVPFGQFLRDLHRLGAEAMVAIVTAHMVRTYLTGSYKAPRQFTWFTGVILLVITLFLSFSGYLLPWDQLAFWAVTIGTSMAEAMPPAVVGETVNLLARGAPDIGANGLLRFYLLHVIFLPLLLILFFFVHYYKVVHFGISLPADEEEVGEDTANRVPADKRVYFLPDVMVDELSFLTAFTTLSILLTVFFFQAPLENIANPQSTPLHTVAPWYFYWLQGLLKVADKFWAGVAVPGILLVLLMAIPYLDMNPSRRARDRRVAIVSGIVAGVVMIVLSWMGTPEYAVKGAPSVEVVQEIMPEEGAGLVREIGYAHLPIGSFRTDLEYPVEEQDEHFAELMHHFREGVTFYEETDPDFNAAYAVLDITQDQPSLKRLHWQVHWYDAQGVEGFFERSFWLHEDSLYWEEYGWKEKFLDYVSDLRLPN
ncbi:MAG: cytochrome bc complex cytochrome b subunit [Caldilineaceae bacterium]|nr:cytochrome bc complex cytochrome b subunit [Caldilineaceae bacterium]